MIPGIVASTPLSGSALPVVTWNPDDKHAGITLTGGNLTAAKSAGGNSYAAVRATHPVIGKRYFEVYISSTGNSPFIVVGVMNPGASLSDYAGADTAGWGYYQENGNKLHGGVGVAYGTSFSSNGRVIGVAVDADSGNIEFSVNGVAQGIAFSNLTGDLYPAVALWLGNNGHIIGGRFKAAEFSYSPPSGYDPMGG